MMTTKWATKLPALAAMLILAAAVTIGLTPAFAQRHGGGGMGGGGGPGAGMDHVDQIDSGHSGGKGGQRGGQGMGRGGGAGQSLRDIFHGMESESATEDHGKKGGSATTSRGKRGSATTTVRGKKGTSTAGKKTGQTKPKAAEKGGSGNVASGTKKGDIYGDMYVILRLPSGVPDLKEITLADGTKIYVVQPIGEDGKPLPLDAEGNLINPELAIPVELGRLNVGRSSQDVLLSQYEELLKSINAADSVTVDASGRLVLTTDGVAAAVDSPLANLALYAMLLETGTLTGVTDETKEKFDSSISYLVDGTFTAADFTSAASFLAAASDKTATLTIDKVVDMNTILGITGINPLTDQNEAEYVDYSAFTYDRESVYGDTTVEVLVKQEDGSYLPTTVNVYDAVFKSTEYEGDNIAAFTQAADDALAVIEYVHDNSVPTTE